MMVPAKVPTPSTSPGRLGWLRTEVIVDPIPEPDLGGGLEDLGRDLDLRVSSSRREGGVTGSPDNPGPAGMADPRTGP